MNPPFLNRTVVVLAVAALVSACGGGGSGPTVAESFAAQLTPEAQRSDRLRAASAGKTAILAAAAISNDQLFQWAQLTYPDLFPGTPTPFSNVVYEGKVFSGRAYANGNYLAVANGEAYGLGPFTANALVNFGAVQGYGDLVCAKVNCGSGGSGTGSLNECIDPAMSSLPTGARTTAVYVYDGLITGEQTVESVITGPASFKGQNAVLVTSTTKGTNTTTVGGFTSTTTSTTVVRSFEQPSANGLVKTLGAMTEATTTVSLPSIPGVPPLPGTESVTSIETVYNPPIENIEFTLALGGSLTKTATSTTTTLSGSFIPPPTTVTTSQTYLFEAKETISVPAGTYSTCRYKVGTAGANDDGTLWLIVGKGIMAKSEAMTPQGVQTVRLKSGTYNGAPL